MNIDISIRPPALAGSFYAQDGAQLAASIQKFLDDALIDAGVNIGAEAKQDDQALTPPKALILPHAGHRYSGSCAAKGYIKWQNSKIKRVILLGPCHRMAVNGVALSTASHWQTPLGKTEIDQTLQKKLFELPFVQAHDAALKDEHCLEVHLPFLQTILPDDFKLLPMGVGFAEIEQIRHILDLCWGDEETGILISTDLSHFLTYEQCRALDDKTAQAIETGNWLDISRHQACGRLPLSGLLAMPLSSSNFKNKKNLKIERVGLNNSGDMDIGDKSRVVGYGAWAVYETPYMPGPSSMISDQERQDMNFIASHGQSILRLAYQILRLSVKNKAVQAVKQQGLPPAFLENRGVFITLEKAGRLRGCIGTLQAHRSLVDDICHNCFAAALKDHRFSAVEEGELADITLSISLLGKPEAMQFKDEADILSQIRPYKDGLILEDAGKRATYLPQVWEQIPEAKDFLSSLKQKAGLPADHWSPTMNIQRYGASKIG